MFIVLLRKSEESMGERLLRFMQRFQASSHIGNVERAEVLRDWPKPLRLNAAAAQLAPSLRLAHYEAKGIRVEEWVKLRPARKQAWIALAQSVLESINHEV
jgi:hypothetical protein